MEDAGHPDAPSLSAAQVRTAAADYDFSQGDAVQGFSAAAQPALIFGVLFSISRKEEPIVLLVRDR